MRQFAFVAPAHNIPYVNTIEVFRDKLDVPLVGVFEPSFHYTIPDYRRLTGLPLGLDDELGVRQNGFHGASGRYGAERVRQMHAEYCEFLGKVFPPSFRLIYNHLGGSNSTHSILNGFSIATSMKFSPQSGNIHAQRVGDMDPYALLYLMREKGLSVEQTAEILSQKSGLAGISGISSGELKEIEDALGKGDKVELAWNHFVDRTGENIGKAQYHLNGVDAIALAGGIGENSCLFREQLCEKLAYLGVELDHDKNRQALGIDQRVSTDQSQVQVYVINTNEEIVVAYFTKQVVESGCDLVPAEMRFRLD